MHLLGWFAHTCVTFLSSHTVCTDLLTVCVSPACPCSTASSLTVRSTIRRLREATEA